MMICFVLTKLYTIRADMFSKKIKFGITVGIIMIIAVITAAAHNREGFAISTITGLNASTPADTAGKFPTPAGLVQDIYPRNMEYGGGISADDAADMWWHYPTFRLGSYDQITNNIRYPNNPDVGRCTPSSMCGAMYLERRTGTNEARVLPPADDSGVRVGYFTTSTPAMRSLPYDPYGAAA